ncbi:hypothetical protein PRIPAC_89268, partial [Pristionchus pacificus]|uniref:Uncharacterized protein n=1 Tax=Pristionchus pacificus TaxID=54126 RepID=A0A2A6B6L0_PRIPA
MERELSLAALPSDIIRTILRIAHTEDIGYILEQYLVDGSHSLKEMCYPKLMMFNFGQSDAIVNVKLDLTTVGMYEKYCNRISWILNRCSAIDKLDLTDASSSVLNTARFRFKGVPIRHFPFIYIDELCKTRRDSFIDFFRACKVCIFEAMLDVDDSQAIHDFIIDASKYVEEIKLEELHKD